MIGHEDSWSGVNHETAHDNTDNVPVSVIIMFTVWTAQTSLDTLERVADHEWTRVTVLIMKHCQNCSGSITGIEMGICVGT